MIVSHKHRFVFLKTRKTGGTSLEIALSSACGLRDIITPVAPEDEEIRRALGYPSPQNVRVPLAYRGARGVWRTLRGRNICYYNHMPAAAAKRYLGRRTWDSYYKFSVERNPFDSNVSLYYWRTRHAVARPTLSEFLATNGPLSNFPIYSIAGRIAVDRVLRYENLASELVGLGNLLGISIPALPACKGGHRIDRRPVADILSSADIGLISARCWREIEAFGYSVESPTALSLGNG